MSAPPKRKSRPGGGGSDLKLGGERSSSIYQHLESVAIAYPILATHYLHAVDLMEVAHVG